jgi:K+-sensing histidine kinase KdpD
VSQSRVSRACCTEIVPQYTRDCTERSPEQTYAACAVCICLCVLRSELSVFERTERHVQDRGNGLPRAQLPLVFDFCYGGSTSAVASEWRVAGATNTPPPLCGLGLGLPTSRLYARHFGGDLAVSGAENGGAEATLWLSRDVHIPEHIPLTCE